MPPLAHVVTGAFGFTGRYIAQRLLARGAQVRTLISHADRPNPFGDAVEVARLNFDDPAALTASLRGADVLYNTYWVRFPRGKVTFDAAVANTRSLLRAAREAGVRRVVHISVTKPSLDSPLPYFRGKAQVEQAVVESGLSYSILRPALIFGARDILINNIAWISRRFEVFGIPGDGQYRLQPIFAEDLADIAVAAAERDQNETLDTIGPETFAFDELVRLIARAIDRKPLLLHLPPGLALLLSGVIGWFVHDVVLTREEVLGLMANLLTSDQPPLGHTRLSDWLTENAATVGRRYASELQRHYR